MDKNTVNKTAMLISLQCPHRTAHVNPPTKQENGSSVLRAKGKSRNIGRTFNTLLHATATKRGSKTEVDNSLNMCVNSSLALLF